MLGGIEFFFKLCILSIVFHHTPCINSLYLFTIEIGFHWAAQESLALMTLLP